MPSRNRRLALGAAFAVVVLAATFVGWRFLRAESVPFAPVEPGRVPVRVSGPGTVQARVPVTLSSRVTAAVISVSADVGDRVKAGQVLVTLDDRDLSARRAAIGGQQQSLDQQVEAARAGVARAKADLDLATIKQRRDEDLLRRGFVAQAVLDASNAALLSARAGLDNARATLAAREADRGALGHESRVADAQVAFTRLATPMDAVVTQRLAEPGTTVSPGTPILRLVDPATLWVAMRVDESVVGRVRAGQAAQIRLRSGEAFAGKVARVAMQSDAATRELDVHVAFDQPPERFAIDQEADVRIEAGTQEGLLVPLAAIKRDREGRAGVLKVVEGRARFTPVATGPSDERRILVRSGLAAGDAVVAVAAEVRDGSRVKAADAPPAPPAPAR